MENGMQYSSFYGDSLRRLKKNKMAMFCACVLILLALMAIFAPLLAPYDPTYQDYSAVRTQVRRPRAINRFRTPLPMKVMIAMAKIRSGNAWKISMTREIRLSIQPP